MKPETNKMKTLLNKVTSALSGLVLFAAGCAMAVMSLSFVAFLAMFALTVAGLAILVSPFIDLDDLTTRPVEDDAQTAPAA